MGTESAVPVIDLEEFPDQLSKLIKACEELGCFRLVNHEGILPVSLMRDMKAVVKSLLDRPMEVKRRNTDVIPGSGYMAPSQINPNYEALGLYDMTSSEAVDAFCTRLDASPQERKTIIKYAEAVHGVMMDIGRKMGEGLGLKAVSFEGWTCQFRINKYNFTPETVGSPGVQIHTDSGFLTILQDDENVGGLEVMDKAGKFVAVDPWPGTILINLGDIATVWSNGRFCNVKHRVLCKEATTRFSIASFLLGPKDTAVEAPSGLINSAHSRLYNPFAYDDYRRLRVSANLHAGEALEVLRAQNGK